MGDQIYSEGPCQCPYCQMIRASLEPPPGMGPHEYDHLHAETENWEFDLWCRCELCRAERRRLANRNIPIS